MLNLKFGDDEKTIRNIDIHFGFQLEDSWLESPFVQNMIKDVNKITKIEGNALHSPVFGVIAPSELSGGVKALILMLYEPEVEYYGSACGNNCAKWILEIAKMHDINLAFGHVMFFPEPFEIKIVNSGNIVYSMSELVDEAIIYLGGKAK